MCHPVKSYAAFSATTPLSFEKRINTHCNSVKVGFSAFAPIVAPSKVPLGENQTAWQAYDSVALLETHRPNLPILIVQGDQDSFLSEQLKPEIFCETAIGRSVLIQPARRPRPQLLFHRRFYRRTHRLSRQTFTLI